MKNTIFKSVLAIVMVFTALPMMGQDFMNVFFKDGSCQSFHFDAVKTLNVSMTDAEGITHSDFQFQHIITDTDEFVFDIETIDSITFTKYSEQLAIINTKNSLKYIFPIVSRCEYISEVEEKIAEIRQSECVQAAWTDGDFLFVKVAGGEIISFFFSNILCFFIC